MYNINSKPSVCKCLCLTLGEKNYKNKTRSAIKELLNCFNITNYFKIGLYHCGLTLFYCLGPKGCVAEASITTMS